MKITLLVTGKTESEYLKDGIREYETRIRRYLPFEIIEVPALKNISSLTVGEQKAREAAMILKQIQPGEILVLLDEQGKELTSAGFANFLNQRFLSGGKGIVFLVGGPFGSDETLRKRAGHILSLSKMTFSHQMVRLFFTEQLYRALTILRGESYHHE
jgi:23S rRNA (pseudouridine1915-N3)-methyltransferase